MDLFSLFIFCPQSFTLSAHIVLDHLVSSVEDILGRTVILFQLNDQRLGEYLLIAQNIANIGPPEFVDGLVVISHYAEILIFFRQKTDKLKLGGVSILILVHHDVFKTFLVIIQHFRTRAEKLHSLNDQIVKVQGVVFFQLFLILLISQGDFLFGKIPHHIELILFRSYKLILCRGNCCQNSSFLSNLCVNLQPLADFLHNRFLVVCIIDGKVIIKAQTVYISSQDPHTA